MKPNIPVGTFNGTYSETQILKTLRSTSIRHWYFRVGSISNRHRCQGLAYVSVYTECDIIQQLTLVSVCVLKRFLMSSQATCLVNASVCIASIYIIRPCRSSVCGPSEPPTWLRGTGTTDNSAPSGHCRQLSIDHLAVGNLHQVNCYLGDCFQGPISISCHKISQCLDEARWMSRSFSSLWNLAGVSAARLPSRLPNFIAIWNWFCGFKALRDLLIRHLIDTARGMPTVCGLQYGRMSQQLLVVPKETITSHANYSVHQIMLTETSYIINVSKKRITFHSVLGITDRQFQFWHMGKHDGENDDIYTYIHTYIHICCC